MSDLYERLAVPQTATALEIKKAYFSLVRRYSPERDAAAFMRIREAYEILSDPKTRRRYDEIGELDQTEAFFYQAAIQSLAQGDPKQAIRLLENMLRFFPHHDIVMQKLAEAYLANGQSGKALRLYEDLVRQEPAHAGYAGRLADAYLERGWHRKAEKQFRQALLLDRDNIGLWNGLIASLMRADENEEAAQIADTALQVSRQSGWDPLFLYPQMIQLDVILDRLTPLQQHLSDLVELVRSYDEPVQAAISQYLSEIGRMASHTWHHDLSDMFLDALVAIGPAAAAQLEQITTLQLENKLNKQLQQLELSDTYDDMWYDLFLSALENCDDKDCPECRSDELGSELMILINRQQLRSQQIRLQKELPELYQLKASFLDQIHKPGRGERLYDERYRQFTKLRRDHPEVFADDDDADPEDEMNDWETTQEPAVRDPDKVGRNEPCPCGSGKKYKKCCGR